MSELREIFRAPNGDEFYCTINNFGMIYILGDFEPIYSFDKVGVKIDAGHVVVVDYDSCVSHIEDCYRVWTEKVEASDE